MLTITEGPTSRGTYELFGETTDTLPTTFPCVIGNTLVESMGNGSVAILVDVSTGKKVGKYYSKASNAWG